MTNNLVRENQHGAQAQNGGEKFITPLASISDNDEGYTIELEMPGVNKEALEISVDNNELTIIGRRNASAPRGVTLHRESRGFNFRRVFEIDPSIDGGKIAARISQGIVTLSLPKAEEVKPRKIAVS